MSDSEENLSDNESVGSGGGSGAGSDVSTARGGAQRARGGGGIMRVSAVEVGVGQEVM